MILISSLFILLIFYFGIYATHIKPNVRKHKEIFEYVDEMIWMADRGNMYDKTFIENCIGYKEANIAARYLRTKGYKVEINVSFPYWANYRKTTNIRVINKNDDFSHWGKVLDRM